MTAVAKALAKARRSAGSDWARADCPYCAKRIGKPDLRESFGANLESGFWHCFRCGASGQLPGYAKAHDAWVTEPAASWESDCSLPAEYQPLWRDSAASSIVLAPFLRYLAERHVLGSVLEELRIGACVSGYFAWRAIVPVFDAGRRLRWFVARSISPHAERKYLYPKGDRAGVLFNEVALDVVTDTPVLLVEGAFDAIRHWPNAVACLGKPTRLQLERVALAKRPVCVALDGDAWMECELTAHVLKVLGFRRGLSWVRLEPGLDPAVIDSAQLMAEATDACTRKKEEFTNHECEVLT
jgi:hypothetical protein